MILKLLRLVRGIAMLLPLGCKIGHLFCGKLTKIISDFVTFLFSRFIGKNYIYNIILEDVRKHVLTSFCWPFSKNGKLSACICGKGRPGIRKVSEKSEGTVFSLKIGKLTLCSLLVFCL